MNKKLALALLSISFILALILGLFAAFQTFEVNRLKKTMETLESRNGTLQEQLNSLNSEKDKLNESLNEQKEENQNLKTQADETKALKPVTATNATTTKNSGKVAYLTFDDGPSNNTAELLDILKENNVKASFFVVASSKDTPEARALMKREAQEGHTVGVHSWSHKYNTIYKSVENFNQDFSKIYNMIFESTGIKPKFMRFPGGTNNTVSIGCHSGKPIMPTLLNNYLSKGMIVCDWNAGANDCVIPPASAETIAKGVIASCKNKNKAIILLHDNSSHETSVEAVPTIITELKAQGYTFKPLVDADDAIIIKPKY